MNMESKIKRGFCIERGDALRVAAMTRRGKSLKEIGMEFEMTESGASRLLKRLGFGVVRWNRESIVQALRKAKEGLGRYPVSSDFTSFHGYRGQGLAYGPYQHVFRTHFGSWRAAMEAAFGFSRKAGRKKTEDKVEVFQSGIEGVAGETPPEPPIDLEAPP